jgi:hypothetical protein
VLRKRLIYVGLVLQVVKIEEEHEGEDNEREKESGQTGSLSVQL